MKLPRLDRHALAAAGLYLVIGAAWIALSDRLLEAMVDDGALLTTYQTYKGWAFVAVMALLAYLLISRIGRQLTALRESKRRLAENEAVIQMLNEGLEQRVAERTLALEHANRELESFAYSVSHDLRAPLRALHGLARLLAEGQYGAIGSEGRHVLDRIAANADRMSALIDDILAFSRTGTGELRSEPTDMRSLAAAAVAELAPEFPAASVELAAEMPEVIGDAAMLRQVWINLIGNALKFSSRQSAPRVVIEGSTADDGTATYCVRDNGAGFDMAYAGRLFGVFQRMHRVEDFPGTGAGLAIAKRVVERHGGRIWAEAQVDAGATFWFTLPTSAAAARPPCDTPAASRP
ncbi:MAG: sensor histidine kinase [Ignavibacteria bacterium]